MYSNLHGCPVFNQFDSTPDENPADYRLKLCFCPLCTYGKKAFMMKDNRGIVSWQHICRVILFSLTVRESPKTFFSLKGDMLWFVNDHWYLFSQLNQFKTNPNKWKKAFLDALSHSTFFESGTGALKKPGYWKLTNTATPWDEKLNYYNKPQQIPLPVSVGFEPSHSNESTVSDASKNHIHKLCSDARSIFASALGSLQIEAKHAVNPNSFTVLHQIKEVQSILSKTDAVLTSLGDQQNSVNQIEQFSLFGICNETEDTHAIESFNTD
ncbi:Myotubularin phosphatase domain-containing protein [Entamoeba marina]